MKLNSGGTKPIKCRHTKLIGQHVCGQVQTNAGLSTLSDCQAAVVDTTNII